VELVGATIPILIEHSRNARRLSTDKLIVSNFRRAGLVLHVEWFFVARAIMRPGPFIGRKIAGRTLRHLASAHELEREVTKRSGFGDGESQNAYEDGWRSLKELRRRRT